MVSLLSLPMLFLNCCNHSNDIIAGWNNPPDAHFTQLRFEAPQVSVIFFSYHFSPCNSKVFNYSLWFIFKNSCCIFILSQIIFNFKSFKFMKWISYNIFQNFPFFRIHRVEGAGVSFALILVLAIKTWRRWCSFSLF